LTFCRDNIDLFVDIIFQSTLIKIFRVQVLMEWSIHVHGEGSSKLPGTKTVCSLLEFLELTIQSNSWSTMHNLLQTQYAINDGYVAFSLLSRVLQCLCDNLVYWTESILSVTTVEPIDGVADRFQWNRMKLENLLKLSNSFQCQHILMNCNELISGWPFGQPKQIVFAFESNFGVKQLQKGNGSGTTKREWLDRILDL
jgi:hypothetical protein